MRSPRNSPYTGLGGRIVWPSFPECDLIKKAQDFLFCQITGCAIMQFRLIIFIPFTYTEEGQQNIFLVVMPALGTGRPTM